MIVETPIKNVLIFHLVNENNLRFTRIKSEATNQQVLQFGRAFNSLQRSHSETFVRETRTKLTNQ